MVRYTLFWLLAVVLVSHHELQALKFDLLPPMKYLLPAKKDGGKAPVTLQPNQTSSVFSANASKPSPELEPLETPAGPTRHRRSVPKKYRPPSKRLPPQPSQPMPPRPHARQFRPPTRRPPTQPPRRRPKPALQFRQRPTHRPPPSPALWSPKRMSMRQLHSHQTPPPPRPRPPIPMPESRQGPTIQFPPLPPQPKPLRRRHQSEKDRHRGEAPSIRCDPICDEEVCNYRCAYARQG